MNVSVPAWAQTMVPEMMVVGLKYLMFLLPVGTVGDWHAD